MKILWLAALMAMGFIVYKYLIPGKKNTAYMSQPTSIIVIPGITGDLAKRKLIPALYSLFLDKKQSVIIGTGRKEGDSAKILEQARRFVKDDLSQWDHFTSLVRYQKLDPTSQDDFSHLVALIEKEETKYGLTGKRIVYLSLPPDLFCLMTERLVKAHIIQKDKDHTILYEKPLGSSKQTAREIHDCLTALISEKQIYLVDHYVAKSLYQLVPSLLKDHALFTRPLESVDLVFHETNDVEGRGEFYDKYGAIKDVLQNHMLQLLSLVALSSDKAKHEEEKVSFLKSLKVKKVAKGQYEGYTQEKGVNPKSTTETYAYVQLASSDPRFKNTLFTLETGKSQSKKSTKLTMRFKDKDDAKPYELFIEFAPKETVELILLQDGQPLELIHHYEHHEDAYKRLLDDVLAGKRNFSVSFPEIDAQWTISDLISAEPGKNSVYKKGSAQRQ